MKAHRPWRETLKTVFLQWVLVFSVLLAGLGLLMMGWDLFLSGVFGVAILTPLEALGFWLLVGLLLVPILVGVELLRPR